MLVEAEIEESSDQNKTIITSEKINIRLVTKIVYYSNNHGFVTFTLLKPCFTFHELRLFVGEKCWVWLRGMIWVKTTFYGERL